jgi:hypothetical protein
MATSGFGPYHGVWLDDAPTKHIGIIPTPWVMTDALVFAKILQAHGYLMPPQTEFFCDFLECLQYTHVGWILTIKINVRVGTNVPKLAEI